MGNLERIVLMSLFPKQKQSHRYRKQTCASQGDTGEEINWEIEIDKYTLLSIKQMTYKDLLYNTRNSTKWSIITFMEKESKKSGYMYMYN